MRTKNKRLDEKLRQVLKNLFLTGLAQGLKPHRTSGFSYPVGQEIFCELLEALWSKKATLEGNYIVFFEFALEIRL